MVRQIDARHYVTFSVRSVHANLSTSLKNIKEVGRIELCTLIHSVADERYVALGSLSQGNEEFAPARGLLTFHFRLC